VREWNIEPVGSVAVVTLDDGKANALLVRELEGLERALDEVERSSAKAVVLTGRPGYFSAGLDLKALSTMSVAEKATLVATLGRAMVKLFLFSRPVVAAVGGHALGGGAILALAADTRIFADGPYQFGLNEVPAGLFVPSFAIELAQAAMSSSRLTELVVHGRVLSPMEALGMHLVEAVHAPEALRAAALMRAESLGALSGPGYALTKRLVRGPHAERGLGRLPGELEQLERMSR
jgi:enoyl-CoA hydratase/carnithine racemase